MIHTSHVGPQNDPFSKPVVLHISIVATSTQSQMEIFGFLKWSLIMDYIYGFHYGL